MRFSIWRQLGAHPVHPDFVSIRTSQGCFPFCANGLDWQQLTAAHERSLRQGPALHATFFQHVPNRCERDDAAGSQS